MSARPTLFVAVAAASLACGPRDTFIALPSLSDDEVLFVSAAPDHIARFHGPLRPSVEYTPQRLEVDDPAEVRFLVVSLGELEKRQRLFDPAEWRALVAESETESCEPGRVLEDGSLRVALDEAWARWLPSPEDPPLLEPPEVARTSLTLPLDEQRCFDEPPLEFRPFGSEAHLLRVGTLIGGEPLSPTDVGRVDLLHARPLDDDRVLAASPQFLHVMERDQAWTDRATHGWSLHGISPPPASSFPALRGLVVDHARSAPDRFRVVLAMSWLESDARFHSGVLAELDWTPAGFGAVTVLAEVNREVHFLALAADGRTLAGGDAGLLLVRAPDADAFESAERPEFGVSSLRGWASGAPTTEPDLFLDRGAGIWFGDLSKTATFRRDVSPVIALSPRHLVARPTPQGPDLYYTSASPEMTRRRADGSWEKLQGYLPPSDWPCETATHECGDRSFGATVESRIAATPRSTALLASSACSAFVEFHPDRGCSRSARVFGIEQGSQFGDFVSALSADAFRVFILGYEGLLLEARSP